MAEEEAPAVVGVGNCTGELVQLPVVEGVTYYEYRCTVCGQIVHVGHEQLAESGVPTEHSPDLV